MRTRALLLLLLLLLAVQSLPFASAQQAGAGDDAAELQRLREQNQRLYESFESVNPLSVDQGNSGAVGGDARTGAAAQLQSLQKLQELLASPAVKGYLQLFSNPAFTEGVNQVIKSPNRMQLFYAELWLFLFMVVFRAWRFSKHPHWLGKLWVNLYSVVLGWGLGVLLLPTLVLGHSYWKTVTALAEVLLKRT